MKTLRAMIVRLAGLFRRRANETEMNEELQAHLDGLIERNVTAGMSAEEARFAARRVFGGVAQIQERARDERHNAWVADLLRDMRYGVRQMRKQPGFSAIVVLVLGIGIGANTAVFSALEVLVWRALPVPAADELVIPISVRAAGQGEPVRSAYLNLALYEALRERAGSLAGVMMFNGSGGSRALVVPVGDGGEATRARTSDVSGSYFQTLNVAPALGRLIAPEDDQKGAARAVAVLSHAYWQAQFGGARNVVGQTVLIEKVPFEIIGVAAEGFGGARVGEPIDVWIPFWMLPAVNPRFGLNLQQPLWDGIFILGRLQRGATREAAAAELNVLYRQVMSSAQPEVAVADQARAWGRLEVASGARGFGSDTRDKGGPILRLLLVVVGLVQLIACANVASLALARLGNRQRELATRTSLGAGRGRIVRQLIVEMLVLVAAGAMVGGLLVEWGFLVAHAHGIEVRPGGWIFLFGLIVSTVTALIVALIPAIKSTRIDVLSALKSSGAGDARSQPWLQRSLVVVQIAVSGCLLAGTGLLVRTLQNLQHVDLGLRVENVVLTGVQPPNDYDAQRRATLLQELRAAFLSIPGVEHVTVSVAGLLTGGTARWAVTVPGYVPRRDEDMNVQFVFAGPDYFATVGLPLVRGRGFDEAEAFPSGGGGRKIVINESVARRFFGDADPLGRRINWGRSDSYEIIGVAKATRYRDLRNEAPLVCYIPFGALGVANVGFQLRVTGDPRAVLGELAPIVRRVDAKTRLLPPETIRDVVRRATQEERTTALAVGAFSGLALLLTALGLYGVLACHVTQRTREIGVRIALGGRPRAILALFLKQGLRLTLCGWACGTLAALALARLIESRLYGVTGTDPITLVGAGLVLAFVAVLACWVPARRATRVDPMVALRAE